MSDKETALNAIRRYSKNLRIRQIPLLYGGALTATDALEAAGMIGRTGRRRGCCCYILEDCTPERRAALERVAKAREMVQNRIEIGLDLKTGLWLIHPDDLGVLFKAATTTPKEKPETDLTTAGHGV
jgi:hypothetical protein